jgi:DNA-binding GntR family transcriptional regulator
MPKTTGKREKEKEPIGHTRKAYLGIRSMMFHNEIVPDQKISYRWLAERLHMSQTPVIQALKWLEFQQLVRHEPNRGYFTAPIRRSEVEEIYEVRELVETSLLPATMRRLDDEAIARLQSALDRHLQAAREVYLYDRLVKDMDFHLTLAALSGRRVQEQVLSNLFDLLYLKYGGRILFSTSMDSADDDHRALFDALQQRNLPTARSVLRRHIRRVKVHVLKSLDQIERAKQQVAP